MSISDLWPEQKGTPQGLKPGVGSARVAQIREALLAAILDHRLVPGTRLPEDEVGAIFGASRTIARAALQSLAHDGLVVIETNRGAHVAQPTVEDALQVFEARAIIEPRVAAMAAGRADARVLAELAAHLREEDKAVAGGDQQKAVRLSATFHVRIADLAGQAILAGFVRELVSRSSLIVSLYWRRADATCERHAHHALVEAIEAGEAERAADLMRSHLVDIMSGLNLSPPKARDATLADLLVQK